MTDIRISELPNIPGQQTVELTGFDLLEFAVKDISSSTGYTSCKGSLISYVTYAQLAAKIAASSLIPGVYYLITDRYNYQSGGTGVPNTGMLGDDRGLMLVQAFGNNALSSNSQRIMACPKWYTAGTHGGYTMMGIHDDSTNSSVNEVFIWGGKYWKNKNGNGAGTIIDDCNLDQTEWDLLDKESFPTLYSSKGFNVIYNFTNDWVSLQKDRTNTVGIGYDNVLTYNPCDVTDWNQDESGLPVITDNFITKGWRNNPYLTSLQGNVIYGAVYEEFAAIVDNNTSFGDIYQNNTNGATIRFNHTIDGITGNKQTTLIENNKCLDITNNQLRSVDKIINNIVFGSISENKKTTPAAPPSNTFDAGAYVLGICNNVNVRAITNNNEISAISNNSNIYGDGILNNNSAAANISGAIQYNNNINGIVGCDGDGSDLLIYGNSNLSVPLTVTGIANIVKNNVKTQTVAVVSNDVDVSAKLLFKHDSIELTGTAASVNTITGLLYDGDRIRFEINGTVTFNHGTIKMLYGINLVTNSGTKDWVEFENKGGTIYHIANGSY